MISIIIPTLNEEKVLEKTLTSLRAYTGEYEIIVSDGQSTDRTVEIARTYADKVVVYEGPTRQTIGMGRNLGASVARGEYLLFLDADMYIPNPDVFFAHALQIFNTEHLVGLSAFLRVFPEMATTPDTVVFWLSNWYLYFLNTVLHHGGSYGEFQMMRTDVFKKLNGYNEKIAVAEDNEFFQRLAKLGTTRIDPSLVVFHTSRRAHKVGWPKLLFSWWLNQFWVALHGYSYHDEWKEIR